MCTALRCLDRPPWCPPQCATAHPAIRQIYSFTHYQPAVDACIYSQLAAHCKWSSDAESSGSSQIFPSSQEADLSPGCRGVSELRRKAIAGRLAYDRRGSLDPKLQLGIRCVRWPRNGLHLVVIPKLLQPRDACMHAGPSKCMRLAEMAKCKGTPSCSTASRSNVYTVLSRHFQLIFVLKTLVLSSICFS